MDQATFSSQTAKVRTPAAINPADGTQTANHANSTDPTSATLSNTAAGYTTLGGRYQFLAPGTAATDYALFGFQVPTGFRLLITGVTISIVNTGAAVAVTATILDWSLGLKSTAVSLATASLRRIPLGTQGFVIGAAIGATAPDIVRQFSPEQVAQPGEFVHIIVEVPLGTATASEVIRGDVTIHGFFESV